MEFGANMRTILVIGVLSALSGTIIGAALAYVQVGSPREVAAEIGGQPDPTPTNVAVAGEFPRIKVDQLEYDFGKMQRGTEQSHRFKISNAGDAPCNVRVYPILSAASDKSVLDISSSNSSSSNSPSSS